MSDYFLYHDRKTRKVKPKSVPADNENAVKPSEPIAVQEHSHADTTIIRRIRLAIREKWRA